MITESPPSNYTNTCWIVETCPHCGYVNYLDPRFVLLVVAEDEQPIWVCGYYCTNPDCQRKVFASALSEAILEGLQSRCNQIQVLTSEQLIRDLEPPVSSAEAVTGGNWVKFQLGSYGPDYIRPTAEILV